LDVDRADLRGEVNNMSERQDDKTSRDKKSEESINKRLRCLSVRAALMTVGQDSEYRPFECTEGRT
jgi:hypothetical protein